MALGTRVFIGTPPCREIHSVNPSGGSKNREQVLRHSRDDNNRGKKPLDREKFRGDAFEGLDWCPSAGGVRAVRSAEA